jgi:hypothetical protein
MDENKLKVLREIEYAIHPACGRCAHSGFSDDASWGECFIHQYEHQKHTDSQRYLSVYKYGSCPSFEPIKYEAIHAFAEFVKGE